MRSLWLGFGLALLATKAHATTDVDARPVAVAVATVTASSTYVDPKDAYAPWHVFNPTAPAGPNAKHPYNHAWCEGKPDEGVGEGITITFVRPTSVARLAVAAGVWKNDRLYASNNHITQLVITTSDGRSLPVAVPKGREHYAEIAVGGAPVTALTIAIGAVEKSTMNDTCISEIQLFNDDGPLAPVIGVTGGALAALPGVLAAVSEAIDKKDSDTLATVADFPITVKGTEWFYANTDEKAAAHTYADADKLAAAGLKGRPAPDLEDPLILGDGPGQVVIPFGSRDLQPKWRFAWRANAWHLIGIGY